MLHNSRQPPPTKSKTKMREFLATQRTKRWRKIPKKLPYQNRASTLISSTKILDHKEGLQTKNYTSDKQKKQSKIIDVPSSKPPISDSKTVSEIDDIFALNPKKLKLLKSEDPLIKPQKQPVHLSHESTSNFGIIKSNLVQIISPEAPLERIDKSTGLPVYKAHILKVGEGGGTSLCPFDCDCCF
jgi:hypothetical protein